MVHAPKPTFSHRRWRSRCNGRRTCVLASPPRWAPLAFTKVAAVERRLLCFLQNSMQGAPICSTSWSASLPLSVWWCKSSTTSSRKCGVSSATFGARRNSSAIWGRFVLVIIPTFVTVLFICASSLLLFNAD